MKDTVSIGEADSVGGHTGGWCDIIAGGDTTEYVVDLRPWRSRYLKIVGQGEVVYYCWGSEDDANALLNSSTPYIVAGAAATPPTIIGEGGTGGTRGVADILFAPSAVFEIPTMDYAFFFYKKAASANSAQITILPK